MSPTPRRLQHQRLDMGWLSLGPTFSLPRLPVLLQRAESRPIRKLAVCRTFSVSLSTNPTFSAVSWRSLHQTRRFPQFQALFEPENCCDLWVCSKRSPKTVVTCGFVQNGARKLLRLAVLRVRVPLDVRNAATVSAAGKRALQIRQPHCPPKKTRRFPHFFGSKFSKPAVCNTSGLVLRSKTVETCRFVQNGALKLLQPAGLPRARPENCCKRRVCGKAAVWLDPDAPLAAFRRASDSKISSCVYLGVCFERRLAAGAESCLE